MTLVPNLPYYGTPDSTLVHEVYNQGLLWEYQALNIFDQFATVKADGSGPGEVVNVTSIQDLAVNTTPLLEKVDITPQIWSENQVQITMTEHGEGVVPTFRVRHTAFNGPMGVDSIAMELVGRNAAKTLNRLAAVGLYATPYVRYAGTANTASSGIEATDVLTTSDILNSVAFLKQGNVPTFAGDSYVVVSSISGTLQIKKEADVGGWLIPAQYGGTDGLYTGEIGRWAGTRWIEYSETPVLTGAGTVGVDVDQTLVMGQSSLAKAHPTTTSAVPWMIPKAAADSLNRFPTVSWHWYGGYKLLRPQAVVAIQHGTTANFLTAT